MRAILVLAILALVGCESIGRLDKTAAPDQQQTVFIIGVEPANVRVGIQRGKLDAGRFRADPAALHGSFVGMPENGYVVGKEVAGTVLALYRVSAHETIGTETGAVGTRAITPLFEACEGRETLVFETAKGKVLYLGDLEFEYRDKRLTIHRRQDLEGARTFVEKNYPQLKGQLEAQSFRTAPASAPCSRAPVPMFIPGRR